MLFGEGVDIAQLFREEEGAAVGVKYFEFVIGVGEVFVECDGAMVCHDDGCGVGFDEWNDGFGQVWC